MLSAREEVERLLSQIRVISPGSAVERATDEISVICRGYMALPAENCWEPFRLTPTQSRIADAIFARPGQTLSRGALIDSVYFDKHEEPDPKVFDVVIMNIRRKLVGSKYSIQTIWGRGFRGIIAN